MANPYRNEEELFARIKQEKITFHPLIWDAVYDYLGDRISAIEMLVSYSYEAGTPMPQEDCEKVVQLAHEIGKMIHKVTDARLIGDEDPLFPIREEVGKIPGFVSDLLQHHISNDCHAIGFIMGDAVDTGFAEREYQEKVLGRTASMISYLNKMQNVTSKGKA